MSADKETRRHAKTLLRQVDAILWTNWNPVGCAVPEDEYTSYAGPIVRMLIDKRPSEEIVTYLCQAYELVRGEKTDGFGERIVVEKLMALTAPHWEKPMRIAFLGLGRMGAGMAANLAKTHEVIGFDPVAAAREGASVKTGGTLAEVVRGAEAVVSMLPAGAEMGAAYDEIFLLAAPGAIMMDCSTIDIETARAVTKAATAKGFAMVDAPVSGGVPAAQTAGLTFMVGGADDAFARAEPILKTMGKAVVHAGASGAGQAAKVCNNMLLAISMIGTCEAFALAEKLGLDARKFFEIASQSSGQCWSMTSYAPVPGLVPAAPSNRAFEGGFLTSLMLKDLRLAHEAASGVEAQTPLGAHALDLYERFAAARGSGRDFSGIIEFLRD